MIPTEHAEVLDALADIGEGLPTSHQVHCEDCEFIRNRWLREEARLVGLAHEQDHEGHFTVVGEILAPDSRPPELGFEE